MPEPGEQLSSEVYTATVSGGLTVLQSHLFPTELRPDTPALKRVKTLTDKLDESDARIMGADFEYGIMRMVIERPKRSSFIVHMSPQVIIANLVSGRSETGMFGQIEDHPNCYDIVDRALHPPLEPETLDIRMVVHPPEVVRNAAYDLVHMSSAIHTALTAPTP